MISLITPALLALACVASSAASGATSGAASGGQVAQESTLRQALALHDDGRVLEGIEVLMGGIEVSS